MRIIRFLFSLYVLLLLSCTTGNQGENHTQQERLEGLAHDICECLDTIMDMSLQLEQNPPEDNMTRFMTQMQEQAVKSEQCILGLSEIYPGIDFSQPYNGEVNESINMHCPKYRMLSEKINLSN